MREELEGVRAELVGVNASVKAFDNNMAGSMEAVRQEVAQVPVELEDSLRPLHNLHRNFDRILRPRRSRQEERLQNEAEINMQKDS